MKKQEVIYILEDLFKYCKCLNAVQFRAIEEAIQILKAAEQCVEADGEEYVPYSNHAPNVYFQNVLPPFPPHR